MQSFDELCGPAVTDSLKFHEVPPSGPFHIAPAMVKLEHGDALAHGEWLRLGSDGRTRTFAAFMGKYSFYAKRLLTSKALSPRALCLHVIPRFSSCSLPWKMATHTTLPPGELQLQRPTGWIGCCIAMLALYCYLHAFSVPFLP